MNPLVSIIIPCYYQAQYLPEALQSVLDQTYQNWECIIVNDGSPDHTEAVAKKWLGKDNRFRYIYKENGGLSSARNTGIEIAGGEFILPLDADDKIANLYVALAIAAFVKNNFLKVVYCKAEKFGDEIGEWNLPDFSLENLAKKNMIFCSAFFKKKDWEIVGGYDSNLKQGIEDWEFWITLLKNGGVVSKLDYVGFFYRIKSISMIKNFIIDAEKMENNFAYVSIKHADFFVRIQGSFMKLNEEMNSIKREYNTNLKSEKFVIDVFCKTFLKFTIFGKYK